MTLHVHYDGEVGEEYVPARVSVAGAGYEPIDSAALTHLRGGGYYKGIDKLSYRIEFHDEAGYGKEKKMNVSVLGMDADTDWLLISNAGDITAVRNYMAYDMWKRWNEGNEHALMLMDSQMVELFVDDEYMGLYQLMERINHEKEIIQAGGNAETDSVVRLVMDVNVNEKPWLNLMERAHIYVEYRYGRNGNAKQVFDDLENYILLSQFKENKLDDGTFRELAEQYVNEDQLVSYYLFLQSCGLWEDNIFNNVFIWMFWEKDKYVYYLSPWDMDYAFPVTEIMENGAIKPYFDRAMYLPVHMLDLNVSNSREKIWALWKEKRSAILSDDALYEWFMDTEAWINASGAYLRETEKWRGGACELNLSELLYYEQQHMKTIEWNMNEYWPLNANIN